MFLSPTTRWVVGFEHKSCGTDGKPAAEPRQVQSQRDVNKLRATSLRLIRHRLTLKLASKERAISRSPACPRGTVGVKKLALSWPSAARNPTVSRFGYHSQRPRERAAPAPTHRREVRYLERRSSSPTRSAQRQHSLGHSSSLGNGSGRGREGCDFGFYVRSRLRVRSEFKVLRIGLEGLGVAAELNEAVAEMFLYPCLWRVRLIEPLLQRIRTSARPIAQIADNVH